MRHFNSQAGEDDKATTELTNEESNSKRNEDTRNEAMPNRVIARQESQREQQPGNC